MSDVANEAGVSIAYLSDLERAVLTNPTLDKLRQSYGPADLRIVFKHMPLSNHPHARPAAEASQAAFALGGSDAFWRFYARAYGGAELPDTFVILCSTYDISDLPPDAMASGARAYVHKEQLGAKTLRRLWDQRNEVAFAT